MANMTTEPHTWTIVFASFWGFHLLFQFFRKASYAFPFAPPRNLGYKDKVDWNGRLVSTVHAVAMVVGTLLALDESRAYSDEDCLFGYGFYPATFASVFMGYLLYDSTYCWYYFKILKDWPSLVHHAIYLMVCGYVLHNMFFKFPFVWLMMGEISTPSVNLRVIRHLNRFSPVCTYRSTLVPPPTPGYQSRSQVALSSPRQEELSLVRVEWRPYGGAAPAAYNRSHIPSITHTHPQLHTTCAYWRIAQLFTPKLGLGACTLHDNPKTHIRPWYTLIMGMIVQATAFRVGDKAGWVYVDTVRKASSV
eukprot:6504346-Pyramimonas_sp.AAC.1